MRVIINTLAFAPFRVFKASVDQVYSTLGITDFEHRVLNQHYPINKAENTKLIREYCESRNMRWFDVGENIGLSGGYNYLIKQGNLEHEDIVILEDPDVWPVTPGWGEAIVRAVSPNEIGITIGIVSLMTPPAAYQKINVPYTDVHINGLKATLPHVAIINSLCGMPGRLLLKLGDLQESNKYYGGFESVNFPRLQEIGYSWAYLDDYKEEKLDDNVAKPDHCYSLYKWAYAYEHSTDLDFESWLKIAYPDLLGNSV